MRETLEREVAFFRQLDEPTRERLMEKMTRFLDHKPVEGLDGLRVDERIRILVAAAACRLTLNLPVEEYRRLEIVYVSPTHVDASEGIASRCHSVILVLDRLEHGLHVGDDGVNVGYHEFAHVLDASDGVSDGRPPLLLVAELGARWTRVMRTELERLRAAVEAGIPTVIHANGIEDEAELFAYATEAFFEAPARLSNAHPDLFQLLAAYYRQDPRRLAGITGTDT
jgi:MtfA peptidase